MKGFNVYLLCLLHRGESKGFESFPSLKATISSFAENQKPNCLHPSINFLIIQVPHLRRAQNPDLSSSASHSWSLSCPEGSWPSQFLLPFLLVLRLRLFSWISRTREGLSRSLKCARSLGFLNYKKERRWSSNSGPEFLFFSSSLGLQRRLPIFSAHFNFLIPLQTPPLLLPH